MGTFEYILEHFVCIWGYKLGEKVGDLLMSGRSGRRSGNGGSWGMKPPRV